MLRKYFVDLFPGCHDAANLSELLCNQWSVLCHSFIYIKDFDFFLNFAILLNKNNLILLIFFCCYFLVILFE